MNHQLCRHALFLALLSLLQGCMIDNVVVTLPEQEPSPYFRSVTHAKQFDRSTLISQLGGDFEENIIALLPDRKIKVDAITYRSQQPNGSEVEASGIIAYPESGEIRGVVVGQHYTYTANWEVPTSTMATIETALALFGYAVIVPDYIGFGSTRELPHPYLSAENTGRVTVDMVFAAREYLATKDISLDQPLYVVGYSQGGHSALAFAKMVESRYSEEISLKKVFAGGGPYDLPALFDKMVVDDYSYYPCSVPMTVLGLSYGDVAYFDLSQLFQEKLLANYKNWYYSKEYSTGQLNKLIGTTKISNFMHANLFVNQPSDEVAKLYKSLCRNSVIDWTPRVPIHLVHGEEDLNVDFVCAQNAYDSFKARGCNVKLDRVKLDHYDTAISFFLVVLFEIGL
ncbi:lipase family protein [Parabacteroides sp. OttesenSCG-928-N08]|nr:lipase family protein [Parabacteroides sp. OttesenSCG-928-N08]